MPASHQIKTETDAVRPDIVTAITERSRRCSLFVLIGGLVFLTPFCLWCFFIYPAADDLSVARWDLSPSGLAKAVYDSYFHRGGLFAGLTLRWLHAHLTMNGLYTVSPLLAILMHLVGATLAFRIVTLGRFRLGFCALIGLVWVCWYISTMPSTAGSLYWATGMIVYEPGNVLTLLIVALSIAHSEIDNRARSVTICLLAFVACGMHYPYVFMVNAVLLTQLILRPKKGVWSLLLMVSVVTAAAVLLAPGNFQRLESNTGDSVSALSLSSLVVTLIKSVFSYLAFQARELQQVSTCLVTLFVAVCLVHRQNVDKPERHAWVRLLMWQGAIFAVFLISAVANMDPPAPRTQNALHFLTMVGCVFFIAPWLAQQYQSAGGPQLSQQQLNRLVTTSAWVLMLLILLSVNYVTCVRELIASSSAHWQYWETICNDAKNLRITGGTTLVIDVHRPIRPITVFHPLYLTSNPDEWPNPNYAAYFGVPEVVLSDEESH